MMPHEAIGRRVMVWCVVMVTLLLVTVIEPASAATNYYSQLSTKSINTIKSASTPLPHVRPPPDQRKFVSTAIDNIITNYTARMTDPDLGTLFSNCYPNTLDTTVYQYQPSTPTTPPTAFIITGDIPAQWFRDSSNQLLPYMRFVNQDDHLRDLVCGLINRHVNDVAHDPFANAFNFNASGAGHQDDTRKPPMTPEVFEGKYELDSLAAILKLANAYWNETGDSSCFLQSTNWMNSMTILVQTIQSMQVATSSPDASPYLFQRVSDTTTETEMLDGMGRPSSDTGMSRSPFRPSDDSTQFPFLIPSQAMTVVELRGLANTIGEFLENEEALLSLTNTHLDQLNSLASVAAQVAAEIDQGIQTYGLITNSLGTLYAYEVDGFGSVNMMDDANSPSLLSLPYLGYVNVTDPVYQATRAFVWSQNQPFFWKGTAGAGIGGPHAGMYQIWPMSLIMFALTSTSDAEIQWCLDTLVESSAGTGFLHESFNKDDVTQFTRPWFAWVNGLFGELICKLADERPYLIFQQQQTTTDEQRETIPLD